MQKQKILLVSSVPPPYHGRNVANEYIVRFWPTRSKFNLLHLDTADPRPINTLGKIDLTNVYLGLKYWLRFILIIIKQRPDFVHLPIGQNFPAFIKDSGFIWIAAFFHIPVVIHLHGGYFHKFFNKSSRLKKWWVRQTLRRVLASIVLGENLRHIFADFIRNDRIFIIPYGIEGDELAQIPQRTIESPKIIFLSNLIKEKGFIDLIKAMPDIKQHIPEIQCVLAGNKGEEVDYQEAQQIITELDLSSYVEIRAPVIKEAKLNFFREAHIFVMPTFYPYEGQPLVLLEAMAAGLPIVTTRQGTIEETIIHNKNGLLIEKNNPEAICEAVCEILNNPSKYYSMSRNSQERYTQIYTVKAFIKRIEQVYNSLLEQL